MNGLNSQIRDRIDAFVQDLSELIRKAAIDSVTTALGVDGEIAPAIRVRPAKGLAGGGARERGGKRTPDEIANTTRTVLEFIASNPGQGVEQIAKALALPTKELTLPIKKLIATKQLATEGQKRATKYFPAAAEAAPAGAARAPGARKVRAGKRAAKGRGRKRG
ncbi:MAG TPA: DNA-binding protein [Polyangiaceae bacterium]|nr:DNA-binding protein [Polyangiaceae bacterium]